MSVNFKWGRASEMGVGLIRLLVCNSFIGFLENFTASRNSPWVSNHRENQDRKEAHG